MKCLLLLSTALVLFSFRPINTNTSLIKEAETLSILKLDSCYFKKQKLYGKVQLVQFEAEADLRVQIVNSVPDLKIKFVENFPDECGEWQIVPFNADFKVYITEDFPDLKIQPVSFFPGLPQ